MTEKEFIEARNSLKIGDKIRVIKNVGIYGNLQPGMYTLIDKIKCSVGFKERKDCGCFQLKFRDIKTLRETGEICFLYYHNRHISFEIIRGEKVFEKLDASLFEL